MRKLRPADIDAARGTVQELSRIVAQIRRRWPRVRIVVRADSGFCRENIMAWCERNRVDYVLGLAKNERLKAEIEPELYEAWEYLQETGQPARVFSDFEYQTLDSWSRPRRVIGKAEQLPAGENPRFIVTSLGKSEGDARTLYEDVYCARGDMENRIKEQQLALFADRTSAATMRANQLRLWLSSVAYVLVSALRRLGLAGTAWAGAQCDTIRLKLLKIGAQLHVTVPRCGCRSRRRIRTKPCSRPCTAISARRVPDLRADFAITKRRMNSLLRVWGRCCAQAPLKRRKPAAPIL